MEKKCLAGIARRIISPPKGIYLIGYGDRIWGNRGIHDDLTATALAIHQDITTVVIIACDLLAINEFTLERITKNFKDDIFVCCSHTHSGPIVFADQSSSRKNRHYVDFLISQVEEVIGEALSDLNPVSMAWGSGEADIAINRRERKPDNKIVIGRNPAGIVDRSIGILQVRNISGKPIANLINYSCHNVVLGPKNYFVSADWAGSMRRRIEAATGIPTLFIQGATADLNPDHDWGGTDSESMENLGKQVAEGALAGMADFTPINVNPIQCFQGEIWLPLETEANTAKPPTTYKAKLSKGTGIPSIFVDTLLNIRYPWKIKIKERNGYWSIPMAISILRLGEVLWVGFGAEVFTEIGQLIKGNSPFAHNIFSSLCNGCIGYLPTTEEYPLGGYEINMAPYFYRLPGRLQPNAAQIAIAEVEKIINKLIDK